MEIIVTRSSPSSTAILTSREFWFLFAFISELFFALNGAFISNMSGIPKLHYMALLPSILMIAAISFESKLLNQYLIILVFSCLGILIYCSDQNSTLSFFQSLILPFFWYLSGKIIRLQHLSNIMNYFSLFMLMGLIIEFSGQFGGLFPVINYYNFGDSGVRYGSFSINPLALGYFAMISGALSIVTIDKRLSKAGLVSSIILLLAANARGAIVTFFNIYMIFSILKIDRKNGHRLLFLIASVGMLFLIILGLGGGDRFSSLFDWQNDEGNLGRINQWQYCIQQIQLHPWGIGAGAMSPIGVGDDPYIEVGVVKSCDSTFLQLAVEYGTWLAIVYILTFGSLILLAGGRVVRAIRRSQVLTVDRNKQQSLREISIAYAIVVAITIQQFTTQTLSIFVGSVVFGLLGFIISQTNDHNRTSIRFNPIALPGS